MLPESQKEYLNLFDSLKQKIRLARQKAAITVNVQLLSIYWEIGSALYEQEQLEGWGNKLIATLSKDLKAEFPDMTGFSTRNLRYMRDFAVAYPHFSILQAPPAKLQSTDNHADIILQAPLAKLEGTEN